MVNLVIYTLSFMIYFSSCTSQLSGWGPGRVAFNHHHTPQHPYHSRWTTSTSSSSATPTALAPPVKVKPTSYFYPNPRERERERSPKSCLIWYVGLFSLTSFVRFCNLFIYLYPTFFNNKQFLLPPLSHSHYTYQIFFQFYWRSNHSYLLL